MHFYNSFLKNILLHMNGGLLKIRFILVVSTVYPVFGLFLKEVIFQYSKSLETLKFLSKRWKLRKINT